MKHKSFTLLELIIVLVIIGIVATFLIPNYYRIVEESKAKACWGNLQVLAAALEIYVMENDALPGNLSQIPAQTINQAYASFMQKKEAWKYKLANDIVDFNEGAVAFAAFVDDLAHGNFNLLRCPANTDSGRSYGMNSAIANMSRQAYQNSTVVPLTTVIIADCANSTFSGMPPMLHRHKHPNPDIPMNGNFTQTDPTIQGVTKDGSYLFGPTITPLTAPCEPGDSDC